MLELMQLMEQRQQQERVELRVQEEQQVLHLLMQTYGVALQVQQKQLAELGQLEIQARAQMQVHRVLVQRIILMQVILAFLLMLHQRELLEQPELLVVVEDLEQAAQEEHL
jgi:hypothetical protein